MATSDKKTPLGGDFAGLSATFNPNNGEFIAIPEYLVPESLLEWGQEPKCLEVLVSEDLTNESLERNSVTVLPSTGCAVDNLETTMKKEEVDLTKSGNISKKDDSDIVSLQHQTGDKSFRLETIFGLKDGHRMRVVLDLIKSESSFVGVKSPMVLVLERRTSETSSKGTIADGGGLDGRTVFRLLGPELTRAKTFVEQEIVEEALSGEIEGLSQVNLPGNVTIAYGSTEDDTWTCITRHVEDGVERGVTREFNGFTADDVEIEVTF